MTGRRRVQWWGQPPWLWLGRAFIVVAFTFVALTADIPFMVICAWIIVAINLVFSALYFASWLLLKRQPTEEVARRLAPDVDRTFRRALRISGYALVVFGPLFFAWAMWVVLLGYELAWLAVMGGVTGTVVGITYIRRANRSQTGRADGQQ